MSDTAIVKPVTQADKIHQVFMWILQGNSQHEIEGAIATTWPDAKSKPLIVSAMTRITNAADPDPDSVLGWAIESNRLIYQRALDAGDFSAALKATKQLTELSMRGRNGR